VIREITDISHKATLTGRLVIK